MKLIASASGNANNKPLYNNDKLDNNFYYSETIYDMIPNTFLVGHNSDCDVYVDNTDGTYKNLSYAETQYNMYVGSVIKGNDKAIVEITRSSSDTLIYNQTMFKDLSIEESGYRLSSKIGNFALDSPVFIFDNGDTVILTPGYVFNHVSGEANSSWTQKSSTINFVKGINLENRAFFIDDSDTIHEVMHDGSFIDVVVDETDKVKNLITIYGGTGVNCEYMLPDMNGEYTVTRSSNDNFLIRTVATSTYPRLEIINKDTLEGNSYDLKVEILTLLHNIGLTPEEIVLSPKLAGRMYLPSSLSSNYMNAWKSVISGKLNVKISDGGEISAIVGTMIYPIGTYGTTYRDLAIIKFDFMNGSVSFPLTLKEVSNFCEAGYNSGAYDFELYDKYIKYTDASNNSYTLLAPEISVLDSTDYIKKSQTTITRNKTSYIYFKLDIGAYEQELDPYIQADLFSEKVPLTAQTYSSTTKTWEDVTTPLTLTKDHMKLIYRVVVPANTIDKDGIVYLGLVVESIPMTAVTEQVDDTSVEYTINGTDYVASTDALIPAEAVTAKVHKTLKEVIPGRRTIANISGTIDSGDSLVSDQIIFKESYTENRLNILEGSGDATVVPITFNNKDDYVFYTHANKDSIHYSYLDKDGNDVDNVLVDRLSGVSNLKVVELPEVNMFGLLYNTGKEIKYDTYNMFSIGKDTYDTENITDQLTITNNKSVANDNWTTTTAVTVPNTDLPLEIYLKIAQAEPLNELVIDSVETGNFPSQIAVSVSNNAPDVWTEVYNETVADIKGGSLKVPLNDMTGTDIKITITASNGDTECIIKTISLFKSLLRNIKVSTLVSTFSMNRCSEINMDVDDSRNLSMIHKSDGRTYCTASYLNGTTWTDVLFYVANNGEHKISILGYQPTASKNLFLTDNPDISYSVVRQASVYDLIILTYEVPGDFSNNIKFKVPLDNSVDNNLIQMGSCFLVKEFSDSGMEITKLVERNHSVKISRLNVRGAIAGATSKGQGYNKKYFILFNVNNLYKMLTLNNRKEQLSIENIDTTYSDYKNFIMDINPPKDGYNLVYWSNTDSWYVDEDPSIYDLIWKCTGSGNLPIDILVNDVSTLKDGVSIGKIAPNAEKIIELKIVNTSTDQQITDFSVEAKATDELKNMVSFSIDGSNYTALKIDIGTIDATADITVYYKIDTPAVMTDMHGFIELDFTGKTL